MAITINGTGSITGLTAGGLPDGSVTAADLASSITFGKILQVVQTVKDNTFVTAGSATDVAVTGLSVSITPSSSSNKILVICNLSVASQNSQGAAAKLRRGGTAISVAEAASARSRSSFAGNAYREQQNGSIRSLNLTFLDSPSTTSATTYDVVVSSLDTGTYVNRSSGDTDNSDHLRTCSYITVMEVAG
jgi:hypothetical protein